MSQLFFALWPDEGIRKKIADVSKALPAECGRLVSQHNWHITLSFLGYIEQDKIQTLLSESAGIKASGFSLQLDHSGWWSMPKVLWLAPSVIPNELSELVEDINIAVKDCGLTVEERPYRPHLTLVRKVAAPVDGLAFAPISWNIKDFCLLESTSTQTGVQYQVVETWPLSSC